MYRALIIALQIISVICACAGGFLVCCVDGKHPVACSIGFLTCLIIGGICLRTLEYFYNYETEDDNK